MAQDLEDFISKRQERLTIKFEAGDVDAILECYHPDIDFTDHAWQADHYDFAKLEEFLRHTYTAVPGLKLVTHGVHGSKEFSVWEWTLKFQALEDDPIRHMKKGQESWLRGCSVHWWRLKDGADPDSIEAWQIVREGDYACPCPVGES